MLNRNGRILNSCILWAQKVLDQKDKYIIFGAETSGFKENDVILDYALIDVEGNELFNSRIKPSKRKRISSEATAIHGIRMADLKGCPTFGEVKDDIENIIGDRIAIGYNIEFLNRLVGQTCVQDGCGWFNYDTECAMIQYSEYVGEESYFHNDYNYQKLPNNAPNALGDCYAVLEVIKKMAATPLSEKGQVSALGKSSQSSSGSPRFQRVVKKKSGKAWWKFW